MDEEKFESLLLDELYGELDDETSAAMKRYAAAHPRAAERLASLLAVRRAASLESLAPPDSLESRILNATREAQVVTPFKQRVSSAIFQAGAWAMRPQTAMAAVFLLMIGSSVLLVRGRAQVQSASVRVTEKGEPETVNLAESDEAAMIDSKTAAEAHGRQDEPLPIALPSPSAVSPPEEIAMADMPAQAARSAPASPERARKAEMRNAPPTSAAYDQTGDGWGITASKASPVAATTPPRAPAPTRGDLTTGAIGGAIGGASGGASGGAIGGASGGAGAGSKEKDLEGSAKGDARGGGTFEAGMTAYRERNWTAATTAFDGLAAGGDMNAALWAARSVREANGCGAALARFDSVGSRAFGTVAGYDAVLEGGRCHRATGSVDVARAHFERLTHVPSHAARAQLELDAIAPRAKSTAKPSKAAPADLEAPATKQKAAH